jgi:hypothetical protein
VTILFVSFLFFLFFLFVRTITREATPTMSDNTRTASPFAGKIKRGYWPLTAQAALAEAEAAGYLPTGRGGAHKLHVQRDWHHAAAIVPGATGVVIRPAWTRAQMIIVTLILTFWIWAPILITVPFTIFA